VGSTGTNRVGRRQLNRAILERQGLLARCDDALPAILHRVAGLQTQYAPTGYIGLWSRVSDFRRDSLTEALSGESVVQATLMRATIHMVAAADYPVMLAAVTSARQRAWRTTARARGLDGVDLDAFAAFLRAQLSDGPRRQNELIFASEAAGFPRGAWAGVALWLPMVRVAPSGTWDRRRADLYGLADPWLEVPAPSEEHAMQELVRFYLGAFGPAAAADTASWSGIPITTLRAVLANMPMVEMEFDDGTTLLDLPGRRLPAADAPAPVRFLGNWEAILLAHARRAEVLPERFRPLIFHTKKPQSEATFLVDGAVAGVWKIDAERVALTPFEPIQERFQRELERERAALEGWLND
jgi:Winged helix DNA-binding domain